MERTSARFERGFSHYKKREKTLLQKEFELLVQDLKKSGLVINENVENIETDKMLVTFISEKKEKKEG